MMTNLISLIMCTCLHLTMDLASTNVIVSICHTDTISFSSYLGIVRVICNWSQRVVSLGVHGKKLAACGYVKNDTR